MEKFNLDLIKNEASTKYNDMKGFSAIDGHDPSKLWDLCSDNGINMDKWFLIGLKFDNESPIGSGKIHASAYLVEKENKEDDFDIVAKKLNLETESVIHKKHFTLSHDDLSRYIKRLTISVVSELSSAISTARIIEEE